MSGLVPANYQLQETYLAKMITGAELSDAVRSQSFIKNGRETNVEGVKYDFSLSQHILKAEFNRPVIANELDPADKRKLEIEPGEVVFVLTEEELCLPNDVVAHLSPKRKLSHLGILTLGGFTIDPGYKGRLLIGLLNIAGTPFPLIPNKKLIAATFYRLEGDEVGEFPEVKDTLTEFPDEMVQMMRKYHPVATHALAIQVAELEKNFSQLKSDIRSHDDWYKEFERISSDHEKKIGELLRGLTTEKESRQQGEDKLSNLISKIDEKIAPISNNLTFLKGAAWVTGGLIALLLIPLLVSWFSKLLGVT
jgi:deoxycytidine triphosphate deaminase